MADADRRAPDLDHLIGEVVVLDADGPYLFIGTLRAVGGEVVVLDDADVHYRYDSPCTSERYVLKAARQGLRANRAVAYVMRGKVVGISRLSDVLLY